MNLRIAYGVVGAILVLALYAWSVDFVSLEGERTVYTVACAGGVWVDHRCNGSLVAADRYRFRAVKARREVLFWTVGSTEPAGKLIDCEILNGRNWNCRASADAKRPITLLMSRGRPVLATESATSSLHFVPKLRWLLLRTGMGWGSGADA